MRDQGFITAVTFRYIDTETELRICIPTLELKQDCHENY